MDDNDIDSINYGPDFEESDTDEELVGLSSPQPTTGNWTRPPTGASTRPTTRTSTGASTRPTTGTSSRPTTGASKKLPTIRRSYTTISTPRPSGSTTRQPAGRSPRPTTGNSVQSLPLSTMGHQARPPTGNSQRSFLSPEPSDEKRRAHNQLGLDLKKRITSDQLKDLKMYFKDAPLSATEFEAIDTFSELWNTLDGHRTIKPGEYSMMEAALGAISAESCLASLKKLKRKAFAGCQTDEEVHAKLHSIHKQLEQETKERKDAESKLNKALRAKSAMRREVRQQHEEAMKDTERTLQEVLDMLERERQLRDEAERKLQAYHQYYSQTHQQRLPPPAQVQIFIPNHR